MTSNIGARTLTTAQGRRIGFGSTSAASSTDAPEDERDLYGGRSYDEAKEVVMGELKDTLSPEFINRVDEIIFFRMLGKSSMEAITGNMLDELMDRVGDIGISIEITDEAKSFLAAEGYDPEYGARPLRRKIQTDVEDNISEAILDGLVGEGDTAIVDVEDGAIVIRSNNDDLKLVSANEVEVDDSSDDSKEVSL